MPDTADTLGVDFWQGREQIDRSAIVPDGFHRTALVAVVGREVVLILAKGRVVGSQRDVSQLRQVEGVMQIRIAPQASRLLLADACGLMQAQHRGSTTCSGWEEEIRPHTRVGFGGVFDLAPNKMFELNLFENFQGEGNTAFLPRKWPHDRLHVLQRVLTSHFPIGRGEDRLGRAC